MINTKESADVVICGAFVIAAGPLVRKVAGLLDVSLPVYNEPHGKIAFEDSEGIIGRDAPLMIWNDPIHLPWSDQDRAELVAAHVTGSAVPHYAAAFDVARYKDPDYQRRLENWNRTSGQL